MVESTMQLTSDERLKTWRSASPQSPKPKRTRSPGAESTESALRLTYAVIIPQMNDNAADPRLGFSRPAMAKACVRNHDFFVQLAQELGRTWFLLFFDACKSAKSDWKRIERHHLEDAAMDLADAVRSLPKPLQEVIYWRAIGVSWRRMSQELKGRDTLSMKEDHEKALALLWTRHGSTVRRIF